MSKLKGRVFVLPADGNPDNATPWEDLTEAEKEAWKERASKRLSRVMSDYYTQHPDEYEKLPPYPVLHKPAGVGSG